MVVELRQNRSTPGNDIGDFQELVQRELQDRKPRNLVLDMRMNGGGDLTTTRSFMQGLPKLVPGTIVVLTSPWTFSAAISSTGYLEQAAPERVTIVGEEVGDRLEFWSEGRPITLARSGIVISRNVSRPWSIKANVAVSCQFTSRAKACPTDEPQCVPNAVGTVRGECRMTGVYEQQRWWLCDSTFDGSTGILGPRFFGSR